jgi:hypothetical protein
MTAKIVKLNSQARSVILYVLRDDADASGNGSAEDVNWQGSGRGSHPSPLKIVYKA